MGVFRYDYIAVVDIDEVIMPLQHSNWSDLIKDIKMKTPEAFNNTSTFIFRHALFLDNEEGEEDALGVKEGIPEWLHMMNHVLRSVRYFPPRYNVKSIHSTERVQVVFNHYALECLGPCQEHNVDPSLGQLNHYRKGCPSSIEDCSEFEEKERDTTVWMIKDQVIANSQTTLRNINITTTVLRGDT